jgi:hypothetical protein
MISMGSTYREKLETTARAKIFWGDAREDVVKNLVDSGMDSVEANGLVEAFVHERAHTIQKMGTKKIFIGLALVALPLLPWIAIMVMIHRLFLPPLTIICLPGSCLVFGGYSLFSGSMMYFMPDNLTGDIAETE